MTNTDFIIIGGGIAGASAGYFLARDGKRVVVLEREAQPGYHSTGRSAALFTENYGPRAIRALSIASRAFFENPPEGMSEHPLIVDRGVLFFCPEGQEAALEKCAEEGRAAGAPLKEISIDEACAMQPLLRREGLVGALLEEGAKDLDVDALHQGFLRLMKREGGVVETHAEVEGLARDGASGDWTVTCRDGRAFTAPVVINAAGAWADEVAKLAGITPIGIQPKRRTACLVSVPEGMDPSGWPMTLDAEENFYCKPDAGKLLVSPADATPVPPHDVQPEEMDVAIAIDRLMTALNIDVRTIDHKWAGLRSFVDDGVPVVGFRAAEPGFFWLAGQGGYGIQTCAAMGALSAALAQGKPVPDHIAERGITKDTLSPERIA
ncbi:Sarcosine oxidase beta subunit [Caenispirillum salinarum AK4]|uniref:Sarcosine oxidase beta subunit n=1 Tax=Caenispirillum salinarum AK4 TaxID=1238182 RepID=K9GXM5_9PROT|nr:FAD-binding oxidoreductase [Caenispirillum salinarum]EKV30017.1 Sarcosine oxidase beta subunit [Caenispirillum salinarum AK4]